MSPTEVNRVVTKACRELSEVKFSDILEVYDYSVAMNILSLLTVVLYPEKDEEDE